MCKYQDADLDRIHNIYPVVYVDVYRQELEIEPNLREKTTSPDFVEVEIILHDARQTGKTQNLGSASKTNLLSCCSIIEEGFGYMLKKICLIPDTSRQSCQGYI